MQGGELADLERSELMTLRGDDLVAAARALGVAPSDCWYVGDKPYRDLICGRRAGIGTSILMRRPDESDVDFDADLVVEDAFELLAHLDKVAL